MATRSSDPNVTRGSANKAETSLRFPLSENLPIGTRLHFKQYSRLTPGNGPTDSTTALITLPMPLTIPDTTNISTSSIDFDSYGMINKDQLNSAMSSMGQKGIVEGTAQVLALGVNHITESLKNMDAMLKENALKAAALVPGVSDSNMGDLARMMTGVVRNPHTNLIFSGMQLRSYNLAWKLSPRSQQESDALLQIINTIKERITPQVAFKGYALDYPDTVEISFYGKVADYLPKYYKAMVTNFYVSTERGGFYKSGAPVEQELSMSLTEVQIITRDVLQGKATID